MRWKIYKVQQGTQKISVDTADGHYQEVLLAKAMRALLAFQNRKQKQLIQFTFASGHRHKIMQRAAIYGL